MSNNKFFGLFMQLSSNMWTDRTEDEVEYGFGAKESYLKCDEEVWDECINYAAENGFNAVVIDLGDAVQYKSHREIAIPGAWSVEKLKIKLDEIRSLGMEPIPKLNFSTSHDTWLGDYHRMVSTKVYYDVVKDLIEEIIDIFQKPTYFHLGCNEERVDEQVNVKAYYTCFRRGKLLWNDLNFYFDCVRNKGVIPWIWADHYWYNREDFIKYVPKDVMISPWYYDRLYGVDVPNEPFRETLVGSFKNLGDDDYSQIVCGSNCWCRPAIRQLMHYITQNTDGKGIKGFLLAPWARTYKENLMSIKEGIYLSKFARDDHEMFK